MPQVVCRQLYEPTRIAMGWGWGLWVDASSARYWETFAFRVASLLFFLMNSTNIDNVRAKHKINHSRFSLLFSISPLSLAFPPVFIYMPEEDRRTGTRMKMKTKSTATAAATHVINSSFSQGEGCGGMGGP